MPSNYKHLFSPIKIRGIDFKNRFILAPPSPNLASPDGLVTHQFVDWFRMFARGGASILYVGNSSIDITECKDEECQLDLNNPHCVLPLSWYSEMAKEFDCHASLEVNHNGKDTTFEAVGHVPFTSSPFPGDSEKMRAEREGREPYIPIEMDQAKIDETVMKYALACKRMKQSGMDIALLHGGHGNLISQFTSPHYNKRTDKYGGSLENRARFAIEVIEKTRELCGEDFVLDFRISADEIIEDGMRFEETLKLMKILKDHGVDMFNISAGLHSEGLMKYMRYWIQDYTMAHGYNVHWTEKVKEYFQGDILLTAVGSITHPDLAEDYLSKGFVDFVAMCRPLMADPDMPKKAAHNQVEDIRPCLRCNECAKRLSKPRVINCAVNPIAGLTTYLRDGQVPKAEEKKRVAVIGGGPAGLQAMFTLVERGHDVTLYEKTDSVGGCIIPAAAAPMKFDMADYLKWLQVQTTKIIRDGKATVRLGTQATPEMIKTQGYDGVIIAIGAEPLFPKSIPGIDKPHVIWGPEAEMGLRGKVGSKVVVVGAGDVGIEVAHDFHMDGRHVEIIEMASPPEYSRNRVRQMLLDENVAIRYNTTLLEIKDNCVVVKKEDGSIAEIETDTVLLAMGMSPNVELVEALRRTAAETECRVVGDAKSVGGNITAAVNGAFQAALHM